MKKYFLVAPFILAILLSCSGMKSHKTQFTGIDEKLRTNDFSAAISQIENAKNKYYQKKDQVLYYLDLGMLYHYDKQYAKSNELLTRAENAIDELFSKSISRAATSLLINDNVLEYSGEDYEDVYLNVFKALNYLHLDAFDDAFVEIRRVNHKLADLEDRYSSLAAKMNLSKDKKRNFKAGKSRFNSSALAGLLSLLLYRTEGKLDDARIDLNKIEEVWKLQANLYDIHQPDLNGLLENNDDVKLDIISFVGKSPDKKAKTLYIHTEKDLIIIGNTDENPRGKQELKELDVIGWDGVEKGYHFKFQLPFIKSRSSAVEKVKIILDGQPVGEMGTIENIEKAAIETFRIKEPLIYLKTITRAVMKGLFAAKRKEEMEAKIDNPILGFAARMTTDALVDATENADLRISRFFPQTALMKELTLKPGVHHLKLEYYSRNNTLLYSDDLGEKDFQPGRLNLLESYYLD